MARAPVSPSTGWICTGCLLAAIAIGSTPVGAQVRLHGRVIDDVSGAPVEGARVTLLDTRGRRLDALFTDERGGFVFDVRRANAVQLRTERIGFREALTPVLHFDQHDFFAVEVRLDAAAVLLAPLEVVARSGMRLSPLLRGFEHRRTRGAGVFFTRDDIERLRPSYISELLSTVPGVYVRSSGSGRRNVVAMGRSAGVNECRGAQIYVDEFLLNPVGTVAIDEVVLPHDVEGIEVYRGLGTMPAEFVSPLARCGVIVIWTRRGGPSAARDSRS